ncbi:MAG: hypothetical protein HY748_16820, partial [Elusimicrobia bacterium]|nr:hypothetical protein [Elusimicrobiota bacterium]
MITNMKGKDFISVMDYSKEELETIFDVAFDLKRRAAIGEDHSHLLRGKSLGMLFASPSTRTRISFETGITQLGGHGQYYTPEQLQLKNKESWKDTAEMISRFLAGFSIRLYNLKAQMGTESYKYGDARAVLRAIAKDAGIPVINMLDDKEHPCQIMADIMTMMEKFGKEDYKKKKIVMSWAYDDRAKSAGVPQTMIAAGAVLGMNIVLTNTQAFIEDSTIRSAGDVLIDAASSSGIAAVTGALAASAAVGGSTSVGVSIGAAVAL